MSLKSENIKTCSLHGFLDSIRSIHQKATDARLMFFLGAGASVKSGIPTAGTLAWKWACELQRIYSPDLTIEDWQAKDPLNLGEPITANSAAKYYSQLYDARFEGSPGLGYAEIDSHIRDSNPTVGYFILAHVLHQTRHNLAVTTNFDNLLADAYALCFRRSPRVFVHESLAGFLQPLEHTPTVAKVHRDRYFQPSSNTQSTGEIEPAWATSLRRIMPFYVPIFAGYGGNDGSVMGFLNSLPNDTFSSGLFWLYYEPDGLPSRVVLDFIHDKSGRLVPISGFDEAMLGIGIALNLSLNTKQIVSDAQAMSTQLSTMIAEVGVVLADKKIFSSQVISEYLIVHLTVNSKAELGSDDGEGRLYNSLGELCEKNNDIGGAIEYYDQSIQCAGYDETVVGNLLSCVCNNKCWQIGRGYVLDMYEYLDSTQDERIANSVFAILVANKDEDSVRTWFMKHNNLISDNYLINMPQCDLKPHILETLKLMKCPGKIEAKSSIRGKKPRASKIDLRQA